MRWNNSQALTNNYQRRRSPARLPLKLLLQKARILLPTEATTEWTPCSRPRPSSSDPITSQPRKAMKKFRSAVIGGTSRRLLRHRSPSGRRFHLQPPQPLLAPSTICLSQASSPPSRLPANLRRSVLASPSSWWARRDLRPQQPVSRLNWHSKFCTNRQCVFVSFSETVWHLNSSAI